MTGIQCNPEDLDENELNVTSNVNAEIGVAVRLAEHASSFLDQSSSINFRFPIDHNLPEGQFELRPIAPNTYELKNDELGLLVTFSSSGSMTVHRFESGNQAEAPAMIEKVLQTVDKWTAGKYNN